jgi:hypothetical protein
MDLMSREWIAVPHAVHRAGCTSAAGIDAPENGNEEE